MEQKKEYSLQKQFEYPIIHFEYDPDFMEAIKTSEQIKGELWWRRNKIYVGAIVLLFIIFILNI